MSKDFQKMNKDDLLKALKEKREAVLNNRFSFSGGRTKKAADTRTLKKEIAQILTIVKTK